MRELMRLNENYFHSISSLSLIRVVKMDFYNEV